MRRYKPCKYGHEGGTYPDGQCKECNRISKAKSRRNVQFKPCIHGHTSGRHNNGQCKDCQRFHNRVRRARGATSRRDLPCSHGHTSGRYHSGECIDCVRKRRGVVKGRAAKPRRGVYVPHPILQKMRSTRKKLGLSQVALEERACVSPRTISKLENGEGRVAFLGPLTQVATALGFNLVLIPRAYREHSQFTIDKASAVVCSICALGAEADRGIAGLWTHRVSGHQMKCGASDLREALFEPVVDADTDLLKHHRDKKQRNRQYASEKAKRALTRSDKREQKTAQTKLRAAKILKEIRAMK